MSILALFLSFAKMGLLCFGGGYMLVPLIISDLVNDRQLLTLTQFGNLVSVAQITPGPVGINTATYVGCIQQGFFGAAAATLGLVVPPMLLACAAVASLNRFKESFVVKGIFKGTRLSAVGLLTFAATLFWGMSFFTAPIPWGELAQIFAFRAPELPAGFGFSWPAALIFAGTLILMFRTKVPMTALILIGALAGAVLSLL